MEKDKLEQHRLAALDLYRNSIEVIQIQPNNTLNSLYINIKNNEFKVAVVGKVKAGKSTFINALLGETLMPSDIREATCAIVEIVMSDIKHITACFLDGHEEKIHDDLTTPDVDEAHEFLKKVAAVQDKYRDLPIAKLNDLLEKHYDKTNKEAVFEEEDIDKWIDEEHPENIHNVPPEEFNRKIKVYLTEHKTGKDIPLKITVGFPHNLKFDQLRLIDTPGIGTTSGLGKKTKEYVEQVDAVIYLHKDSPTEESLQNAWNNVISERAKKNTFLVLTHRGSKTAEENDALHKETQRTFSQIANDRVFTVDSLTALALNTFYGKSFEEIEAICEDNAAYELLCSRALRKSKGNIDELLTILEQQSNMTELHTALKDFSEKALSIQLHDFVMEMKSVLEVEENDRLEELNAYKEKLQDPQSFARAIELQKIEMDKLKDELNSKTASIRDEYSLSVIASDKATKFSKIYKDFELEVNGKEFKDSDTRLSVESYMEKIYLDLVDKIEKFIEGLKKEVMQRINDQAANLDGEFNITIPKVVLSGIWEESFNKAKKTKSVEINREGFFGWVRDRFGKKTKEISYFHKETFIAESKQKLLTSLTTSKIELLKNTDAMVSNALKQYISMMKKKLEDRELFLDNTLKEQSTNEELEKNINALQKACVELKVKLQVCDTLSGELSC